MSTAFYPQGMKHNISKPYKTWKGNGYFSNPIGITWGNIRPYTNGDLQNDIIYKPGPRPIKHYRKGITTQNNEVKSSRGSTLVSQLIDLPGCYSTTENTINEINNIEHINQLCSTSHGVAMIRDIYPNVNYYEKPPVIMKDGDNPIFSKNMCCSQQKNALKRVRTSTNIKQNYYTNNYQYLQNRCQTYNQRIFNFVTPGDVVEGATNSGNYVANCLPNFVINNGLEIEIIDIISRKLIDYDPVFIDIIRDIKSNTLETFLPPLFESIQDMLNKDVITIFINKMINLYPMQRKNCSKVIYKPNNEQFAVQGAVSSSTYILKKDVVALEKAYALQNNHPYILKTKSSIECNKKPKYYNQKYTPNLTI
jgi:hypothetical protein